MLWDRVAIVCQIIGYFSHKLAILEELWAQRIL